MANAQIQARALGLDEQVAKAIFTSMIDVFIAFEQDKHQAQ